MQKPLKSKGEKKKQPPSRHGKISKTKKGKRIYLRVGLSFYETITSIQIANALPSQTGRLEKPPKKSSLKAAYNDTKDLTKHINKGNERQFAAVAQNAAGKLSILRLPVNLTADEKSRQKKHNPVRAGEAWGGSSKQKR